MGLNLLSLGTQCLRPSASVLCLLSCTVLILRLVVQFSSFLTSSAPFFLPRSSPPPPPPPPTHTHIFFSSFISPSSAEIRLASYSCVYFKEAKRSFRFCFSFAPVPYRSSSPYFFFYYFFVSDTPVLLTENGTGVLFSENKDIAAQLSFGT